MPGVSAKAWAVAWSTTPVAVRPLAFWNAITAADVPEPKMPSAPPRTVTPALISARCNVADPAATLAVRRETEPAAARSGAGSVGGGYGGGGAEGGEGCLVDLGGDLDPLGVLEAGQGVDGVDAEGAVGVAVGLVAAGDEGGLELAHGVARAPILRPNSGLDGVTAAGAGAGAAAGTGAGVPRAARVASSTLAVTLIRWAYWKLVRALTVLTPKVPSASPLVLKPRATRVAWSWRTASPGHRS